MSKLSIKHLLLVFSIVVSIGAVNGQDTLKKSEELSYIFDTVAMVPTTPVKSQHKSGTCWSYATTSFVETEILRTSNKSLNLAEIYFVYYSYLNKADNYVRLHGKANFSAGGQAHDVMNVIRDYGFVSEDDYRGLILGFDNHVHGEFDNVLKGIVSNVVKNPSGHLSQAWKGGYQQMLNAYIGDATELEEKANNLKEEYSFNADDYVEITSYMYKDYYQEMNLQVPDNWDYADYYNVPLDDMMEIVQNALKTGYSVCWDGDVSSKGFSHRNALAILPESDLTNLEGTEQSKWEDISAKNLKTNMYSFKSPVPEKKVTEKSRQEAFDDYTITDDHLMHLTGLLKDQNGTFYYVTKNSWKANSNKNGGCLNMSDAYLRMATVAIMVHKDAIPKAIRKKMGIK